MHAARFVKHYIMERPSEEYIVAPCFEKSLYNRCQAVRLLELAMKKFNNITGSSKTAQADGSRDQMQLQSLSDVWAVRP